MVRNEKLASGKTFRETLLSYFDDKKYLDEIEQKLPLLTIMVPELPEGSFSASIWDVDANQYPTIAVDLKSEEGINMFTSDGQEFMLPRHMVPAFPVVVVKNNERITTTPPLVKNLDNVRIGTYNNVTFYFMDENFNNYNLKDRANPAARFTYSIDQKVIDASTIGVEWHRDYIYYGLTPTQDRGPFSYDFEERITSMRFNDGSTGYTKISDQSEDPKAITDSYLARSLRTAWTDGSFEFQVDALINSKSTGQPVLPKRFGVKGSDLFDIQYIKSSSGLFGYYIYIFKSITSKTFYPYKVSLMNWDLYNYSAAMAISISEFDISETITSTDTYKSTFATNFSIEGTLKKIGLKFGASYTEEKSQTQTITKTLDSDFLGSAEVNFADKVIIRTTLSGELLNPTRRYETREYSTGYVSFSVEPVKVQ